MSKNTLEQAAIEEFHRRSSLDVVMDDEDAARQDLRRVALRVIEHEARGLRILAIQKGVRCLAFDCYLLAKGHGEIVGLGSAVEAAKLYRVTKQAATECIDDFQKALNIPPMANQRAESGRRKMISGRKKQLTTKEPK